MRAGARIGAAALVWVGGFAALRLSFLAPEQCPAVTSATLDGAAVAAVEWFERGQSDDGRYVYEYDRADDRLIPGYNIVRHAGVTMSIYQLARAGHPEVLSIADDGLDEILSNLVPAGDGIAYVEPGAASARLGASALAAAALAQRRDATGDDRYDGELRGLGRFMVGQITTGGQMLSDFDLGAGRVVPAVTSRYSTGEAAWAFAQLHNLFPGEGWDAHARRVLDYLATARDEVEDLDFPPWADQWAAYTLGELAPSGLDPHHVDYARSLAGRFGMLMRSESQKKGWPLPSDLTNARGAGLGVWAEGLGGLANAARVDDRLADLREPLQERIRCGAGIMLERQVDAVDAAEWPSPSLVEGAWFRADVTRMDDQQHSLSGILAAAGQLDPVGQ